MSWSPLRRPACSKVEVSRIIGFGYRRAMALTCGDGKRKSHRHFLAQMHPRRTTSTFSFPLSRKRGSFIAVMAGKSHKHNSVPSAINLVLSTRNPAQPLTDWTGMEGSRNPQSDISNAPAPRRLAEASTAEQAHHRFDITIT